MSKDRLPNRRAQVDRIYGFLGGSGLEFKVGFVQNAWLRWVFVLLKVQGCLGLVVFVGRGFWSCRCFCRFKGEMLGAMSDDAGTESKPKRIKVGDCQNYGPFLGPYYNTGPHTGRN